MHLHIMGGEIGVVNIFSSPLVWGFAASFPVATDALEG